MPTNYTGSESAVQSPGVAPAVNTPPTLALPVDTDAANAASIYQALKILADNEALLLKILGGTKTARGLQIDGTGGADAIVAPGNAQVSGNVFVGGFLQAPTVNGNMDVGGTLRSTGQTDKMLWIPGAAFCDMAKGPTSNAVTTLANQGYTGASVAGGQVVEAPIMLPFEASSPSVVITGYLLYMHKTGTATTTVKLRSYAPGGTSPTDEHSFTRSTSGDYSSGSSSLSIPLSVSKQAHIWFQSSSDGDTLYGVLVYYKSAVA